MRDLSALKDGFSLITMGHSSARMYVGDAKDTTTELHTFSAKFNDPLVLVADHLNIVGNVQSSESVSVYARLMQVNRLNVDDPMGIPDSGITARDINLTVSEQLVVAGWLKGDDSVVIDVTSSTGIGGILGYPEINSFTGDLGSLIQGLNPGSRIEIQTSHSIISGSSVSALGAGSSLRMTAGTGMTILQGAVISARDDDASIALASTTWLHLDSGSAVTSGARFDYDGSTPIPVVTGNNASASIITAGELKLSGSVTAAGTLTMEAGETYNDFAEYFDTLPGRVLASSGDAVTITAILDGLRARTISDELRTLFSNAGLDLDTPAAVTAISPDAEYLPFENLSDADKARVAESLGYTVYAEGGYFDSLTGAFRETLTEGSLIASNAGYTLYEGPLYYNAESGFQSDFLQGPDYDYSNALVDWSGAGVAAPAADAGFDSLTGAQKMAVAAHLGYLFDYAGMPGDLWWDELGNPSGVHRPDTSANWADLSAEQKAIVVQYLDSGSGPKNFFNYNAPAGSKLLTTFNQGPVADYNNADIYWGDAGAPAADASFASLTAAQKAVVARALGFEVIEGQVWYKADAPEGQRLVTRFVDGVAADFDLDAIDWGGVRAPAEDATFESLSLAQRNIVLDALGYAILDKQVFYNPDAAADKQVILMPVQGDDGDYYNTTLEWGDEIGRAHV